MRAALASYRFRNGDVGYNISQIERGLRDVSGKADVLCFGEAFLQGFDSLSWDFETDRHMAVSRDSGVMEEICALSLKYGTDLIFGYIELDGESIYSSCAVIENGRISQNYRRISAGWKESRLTDGHYREGTDTVEFTYRDRHIMLALCGDLWDCPDRFRTDGLLIWPVFVDLPSAEWENGMEEEYAAQALLAAENVLMVDSFCPETEPEGSAGTFYFRSGRTEAAAGYGAESILTVDA